MPAPSSFDSIYQKLNEQQRRAVDAIEGPVMVIAGPGTGKTQILSARIVRILQQTGVAPSNILCLTYTDAATQNMQERLFSMLGQAAYNVNVFTFHGFCSYLIQHHPAYFPQQSLQIASDIDRIELALEMLGDLPKEHVFKQKAFKQELKHVNELLNVFNDMEKENLSVEYVLQKIDEEEQQITERRTDKEYYYQIKSKQGQAKPKLQEYLDRNEILKSAIPLYTVFKQKMKQKGFYNFNDMIIWSIEALQQNPLFLLDLQERFQYILVDEFQDNNNAQFSIIELLSEYWGKQANVFVVGDDDQSIFRFQGANIQNMLRFSERYGDELQTIVLNENYRSSQNILDLAEQSIQHNPDRLVQQIPSLSKKLIAANPIYASASLRPQINLCASYFQEMNAIADRVEFLIQEEQVPLNEIVILQRALSNSKEVELLKKILNKRGLPFRTRRQVSLFKQTLILRLIQLVEWLNLETSTVNTNDALLFQVLHAPFFALNHYLVQHLFSVYRTSAMRNEGAFALRYKSCLSDIERHYEVLDVARLLNVLELLDALLLKTTQLNALQLIETLIQECMVLEYVFTLPNPFHHLESLRALVEYVGNELQKKNTSDISSILLDIKKYEQYAVDKRYDSLLQNNQGIEIGTIHSVKGLEYEHVFVLGMSKAQWEKKTAPPSSLRLPICLLGGEVEVDKEEHVSELRRLLYVAITRAKRGLYFSHAADSHIRDAQPSQFLNELIEPQEGIGLGVNVHTASNMPAEMELDILKAHLYPSSQNDKLINADYLRKRVNSMKLSATALNQYMACPRSFYFEKVLRIPQEPSLQMVYGSLVHASIQQVFLQLKNKETRIADQAKSIYLQQLSKFRFQLLPAEYKKLEEQGLLRFEKYYSFHQEAWNQWKEVKSELSLKANLKHIVLEGHIDLIFQNEKGYHLVDFKTGKKDKSKLDLTHLTTRGYPAKGDHARQAVFYKLLLELNAHSIPQIEHFYFSYVESESLENADEQIDIGIQDVESMKKLIEEVWNQIQGLEFDQTCKNSNCKWCNFHKNIHI